jgi:hypothetical protein
MKTNKTGIVLIATGEYSDYCTSPFRVMKPFTFKEAAQKFEVEFVPEYEWERANPDAFVGWLNKNGYIADIPEIEEYHVGCYGRLDVSGALADVVFEPKE